MIASAWSMSATMLILKVSPSETEDAAGESVMKSAIWRVDLENWITERTK